MLLTRTHLVEVSLLGLVLVLVAGAYVDSRVTSARAEAEHKANQALQAQLDAMKQQLEQGIAAREMQFRKDEESLLQRFDAAQKSDTKTLTLLSQLAKLPAPVTITTPAPTKENPNPAPVATVPQPDFGTVVAYAKDCETCKLEQLKDRADLADRQKQMQLAEQQIQQLKRENQDLLKPVKHTFFQRLKTNAKQEIIGGAIAVAVVCALGHCKP